MYVSNSSIAVFSYLIVALFTFIAMCNVFAISKDGRSGRKMSPLFALFLGILWPIGIPAVFIAFGVHGTSKRRKFN